MARTSSKAKKTKREVMKNKKVDNGKQPDREHEESDGANHEDIELSAVASCPLALDELKNRNEINDADSENEQAAKENEPNKRKSSVKKENDSKYLRPKNQAKMENKKFRLIESENENEESRIAEIGSENGATDDKKTKKNLKRKGNKVSGTTEKKAKASKAENEDEPLTDGIDYEVEKIIEMHSRKDGTKEFLIRWKGYKAKDDTWEPEAHLDCKDLIAKFMERVNKAKSMPAKELREKKTERQRFVPNVRIRPTQRHLRTKHVRSVHLHGLCEF